MENVGGPHRRLYIRSNWVPFCSMGTKPKGSKVVVPGRIQLLPSGYEKLTICREKNEERGKAQV